MGLLLILIGSRRLVKLILLIFIVITGLTYLLLKRKSSRYLSKNRIEKYLPKIREEENYKMHHSKNLSEVLNILGSWFKEYSFVDKWSIILDYCDLKINASGFFIVKNLSGFIISSILLLINPIFLPIGYVIGFLAPNYYVKVKSRKVTRRFQEQLPEAIQMLSSSVKSGFSIVQAMQLICKEMNGPIQKEFAKTLKEINLGVSLEDAFNRLTQRVSSEDLKIVVSAILIQRTVGGNLSNILETVHRTIRDRIKMKNELNTLTAQGKMSAIIITSMPFIVGALINFINPTYFEPMLTQPIGQVLICFCLFSITIGWFLIKKTITIEV